MMVLIMPSAALIFENTRIWPSLRKQSTIISSCRVYVGGGRSLHCC